MKKYRFPPVASRFGGLIHANQFIKNPFPILDDAVGKLGTTYTFFMGGIQKAVLTIDPVVARHVLQKHHRAYEKSSIATEILSKYTGKGLLTSTGDHWLRQRRLIQPGFHRKKIESLQGLMQSELITCMEHWSAYAQQRKRFDAYGEMNQLTFRIVARALFSTSIEEHGLSELSKIISVLQEYIIREVRQPYKRWWFRMSGTMDRHIRIAKGAREIIREIIRERKNSAVKPDDLLTMLLDVRYEDSDEGMDEEQLIDECLILFVAGHETSANALSWMIFLLGSHPEQLIRLQTDDKEKQAGLAKNIILETMRLYSPAWVVDRISLEDDDVKGYILPAGTIWIIYIRGMHRHSAYWEKAESFDPDRWNDLALHKDAYMPFGAGPRMCIGEHFAMMEMQLIITDIVNRWDITLHTPTVTEMPLITLRPGNEILISVTKRAT